MKKQILLMFLLVGLGASGCGRQTGDPAGPDGRPLLLTTVGMVTDVVARIAPARVRVEGLLGAGVDPHLYKPNADDVRRIRAAEGILYAGLHLEGKLQPLFEDLQRQGKRVAALSSRLPQELLLSDPSGQHDPHVWMDARLWARVTAEAASLLREWYPQDAEEVDARARALLTELEALDAWTHAEIARIPRERRVLITAHDAFGYFGRRYDIEVLGIQGLSTESEAGLRRLNELVELLVARGIPAVFVESTVSDKNVRALVEGARSRGHTVRIGGELLSDAMGAEGTPEGTYIGMIRHNASTLSRALLAEPTE